MGTEGDKTTEVTNAGGQGGGEGEKTTETQTQTTQTQTGGGGEGEKRTTEQVKADERIAYLESLGIKDLKDIGDVIELSKLGYAKVKADFEAEQEKNRTSQVDEAKELSKTQFYAKYGNRFSRDKQGNLIVPPEVLHEMLEDNKVEAAKIADQIADEKLQGQQKAMTKLQQDERAAYEAYWNDPKNADLLNGVVLDDEGNEVRAADEVNRLVNSKIMKPSQAAYTIRKAMKTYQVVQERSRRESDKITRQYEGNWNEDIPENELPAPIRAVRPRLQEVKKRPEGERGSDSFFEAIEKQRAWSS